MMTHSGILLGFIVASTFDYSVTPYVEIGLLVLFLVLFLWFPDSPESCLLDKDEKSAKRALQFYQGKSTNFELWKMSVFLDKMTESYSIVDLLRHMCSKGFFYGVIVLAFRDLCGIVAFLNYSSYIFKESNADVDFYASTIVLGTMQILGSILSVMFVEKYGRRVLLLISASGTGIALVILGFYYMFLGGVDFFKFMPLLCLSVYVFMAPIGIVTLPYVILLELIPPKIRSVTATISLAGSWFLSFMLVYFFFDIITGLGLSGTFLLFGVICLIEVPFVYFLIPETRNLTFEDIRLKLKNGKL